MSAGFCPLSLEFVSVCIVYRNNIKLGLVLGDSSTVMFPAVTSQLKFALAEIPVCVMFFVLVFWAVSLVERFPAVP